jgi:hypothetical protein
MSDPYCAKSPDPVLDKTSLKNKDTFFRSFQRENTDTTIAGG